MKSFTSFILSAAVFIYSVYSEEMAKEDAYYHDKESMCNECIAIKSKCLHCSMLENNASPAGRQALSEWYDPQKRILGYSNLQTII